MQEQSEAQTESAKDVRIAALEAELAEARRQQEATREVLNTIGHSGNNLEGILDTILATAAALIGADRAAIRIREGERYRIVAQFGYSEDEAAFLRSTIDDVPPLSIQEAIRARRSSRTLADHDPVADRVGVKASLAVPLIRDEELVGVLGVWRTEPADFTDRQVMLAESFAVQAVIAIENARLFGAEQARARELQESLEYQTATSEILSIISRSPSDVQEVLDQISETAARLCEADYTAFFRLRDGRYHVGASNRMGSAFIDILIANPIEPGRNTCVGRTALERRVIHVEDTLRDAELTTPANQERQRVSGIRTVLGVPIMLAGEPVAVVFLARCTVRAFSDRQIALVQTLGEQALVAIENARLFEAEQARTRELQEALDTQTATSEVLKVISEAPTDSGPVFNAIAKSIRHVTGALQGSVFTYDGDLIHLAAFDGIDDPIGSEALKGSFPQKPGSTGATSRAISSGMVQYVPDVLADANYAVAHVARAAKYRSIVSVPMLRDGKPVGAVTASSVEPGAFSEQQIAVLQTFADQAVIAMNNARLFEAEQARSRELQEALEYQRGGAEVLQAIAGSPGRIEPVLNSIASIACDLCAAHRATVWLAEAGVLRLAGHSKMDEPTARHLTENPIRPSSASIVGRVVEAKSPVQVADVMSDPEIVYAKAQPGLRPATMLGVPLMRQGTVVGVISVVRTEVAPFSDQQVRLITTFADQAVIAIENARLFEAEQARTREVEAKSAELQESLEYQAAASEVLQTIARTPNELQPVLDAIVQTAARLCQADGAGISRLHDGVIFRVSFAGFLDEHRDLLSRPQEVARGEVMGRAILDRKAVHIIDAKSDAEFTWTEVLEKAAVQTLLGVPLMRDGTAIGAITLARKAVRPFTDKQIHLVSTFADQAVIAIENARLFEAEQARTREVEAKSAELEESLEYQTAISEVLKVISRSPSELGPVFGTIVRVARHLCDAERAAVHQRSGDGRYVHLASDGPAPFDASENPLGAPVPIDSSSMLGRVVLAREPVQILDAQVEPGFTYLRNVPGNQRRSMLGVPLMHQGEVFGTITLTRTTVLPFSERQVALVSTFADQAVIAIENARLFEAEQARTREVEAKSAELQESLGRQTATGEVLSVIARSPTEVQPVLETIVATARELCDAERALVWRVDGDGLRPVASDGLSPERAEAALRHSVMVDGGSMAGRAVLAGRAVQVADVATEPGLDQTYEWNRSGNLRTVLATPLLRKGEPIGAITVSRTRIEPFSDKHVSLIETFADQAVIAIENARLFEAEQARTREVEAKSAELQESLEYQTAISDVLGVISASPGALQPVFDTIVSTVTRLCQADRAILRARQGDHYPVAAHFGLSDEEVRNFLSYSVAPTPGNLWGAAVLEGRTIHNPDTVANPVPERPDAPDRLGVRSGVSVPLNLSGRTIGALTVTREQAKAFEPTQIRLLETFADQAVIAIENARLLEELQARQKELEARTQELAKALESQTAISNILAVISRFQFKLPEIFNALAESAGRLCEAERVGIHLKDGDAYPLVAHVGFPEELARHISQLQHAPGGTSLMSQILGTGQMVHIEDGATASIPTASTGHSDRSRSFLGIPLSHGGEIVGAITLGRLKPRPFTKEQIQLVQTYADQAVIAIENARLLEELQARQKELEEALEQQTAAADVLAVISSCQGNLQPVFETVLEKATKLSGSSFGNLFLTEGEDFRLVAAHGAPTEFVVARQKNPVIRTKALLRAVETGHPVQISDLRETEGYLNRLTPTVQLVDIAGARTLLVVPLMQGEKAVGAIGIYRREVEAFDEKAIALVVGFAKQAVIAIENARLLDELQRRQRELTESLEYQTATSEVLGVISRSPSELQPVLNAIMETAASLCRADSVHFRLLRDGAYHLAASHLDDSDYIERLKEHPIEPGDDSVAGRVALSRATVHVPDVQAERTGSYTLQSGNKARTALGVPLLRDGVVVGVIVLFRNAVEPFAQHQIDLVTTFANQAVIAINNVGLFEQVQARTKEVTESLEYQTASSEVLGVISRSPNELRPVLNAIAETANRICDAEYTLVFRLTGGALELSASHGASEEITRWLAERPLVPSRGSVAGRAVVEKRTEHFRDVLADPEFATMERQRVTKARTSLGVPLLRGEEVVGVIVVVRTEVKPFTEREIALVGNFADQAVIAINNVGLFEQVQARTKELTESLEYQTATSEVLGVISRSPSELQPVLDTIAATARELCDAENSFILRLRPDDGQFHLVAAHSGSPEFIAYVKANPAPAGRGSVTGRAAVEKRPVHIVDTQSDPEFTYIDAATQPDSTRTRLGVPLLKGTEVIGVIVVNRREVRPFTQRQIDLVATFADQAVIAINNVGLFEEVQARTKELTESLEYQTAISDVLGVISRSPNELKPVLDTIVGTAQRLCEGDRAQIFMEREGRFEITAHSDTDPHIVAHFVANPIVPSRATATARAALEGRTVHVPDVTADPEYDPQGFHSLLGGSRLVVPLRRAGKTMGLIAIPRRIAKPFTERQIALVTTFADQAVIAVNNVGLFEQVQARTKELQERSNELSRSLDELRSLSDVGRVVSSSLDMREVLETVLKNACRMTYTSGGTVYVYDKASGTFRVEAGYNMSEEHIERVRSHPMRIGDALVGECAQRREAVQVADLLAEDASRTPLIGILVRAGVRAILAVPLIHQGEVVGALVVRRNVPGAFSPELVRLLETFAAQSAIAVNNARLFEEIRDKSTQLEQASQHKSQFLANMSHELRTPLNAILGYTELMQDGIYGDLPEKASGVLGRVQSNGKHLLGLINQVLDLSKIEAGQFTLNLSEYSVSSIVETVVAATESLATEKKLALKADVAREMPRGIGDEQRIVQVLLNLVGNAIKFTDRGEVRILAGAFAGRFEIAVVDTGPGIAPEEIGRIFEEFHQVDSSNTKVKGGTGLGLAIAKSIVEMHGGRISVESTVGRGSTFKVELPVRVEQGRRAEAAQ